MGVYIKGMEMPEKGFLEISIYEDGTVQITGESVEYDGKYYYTPADNFGAIIGSAIEIPPHGRLIDADALTALLTKDIDTLDEYLLMPFQNDKDRQMWLDSKRIRQNLITFLSLLPTVIEEE